jgi:hypothetical protein
MPNSMMRRWLLAALACGAGAGVQAQTVYRCVSGDAVRYQSQPCPQGTASRRWDYAPEPAPSPALQARLDAIGRELVQRNRPVPLRAGRKVKTSRSRPRADACERARGRQQASLDRLKLKRTHDQLRRLEDEVTRHCR